MIPISCDSKILEFYISLRAWALRSRKIQLVVPRVGKQAAFPSYGIFLTTMSNELLVFIAFKGKLGQATRELRVHPPGRTAHEPEEKERKGEDREGRVEGWREEEEAASSTNLR